MFIWRQLVIARSGRLPLKIFVDPELDVATKRVELRPNLCIVRVAAQPRFGLVAPVVPVKVDVLTRRSCVSLEIELRRLWGLDILQPLRRSLIVPPEPADVEAYPSRFRSLIAAYEAWILG